MLAQRHDRRRTNRDHSDRGFVVAARQTDVGWIAVAWPDGNEGDFTLERITIGHTSPKSALSALDMGGPYQVADDLELEQRLLMDRLERCCDGTPETFEDVSIALDHLAPFAKKVVQRCRQIPAGKTLTYGQLAAACGSPKAARAVGNVMASNRFPLVVPCHRVVGSGGGLGGFSAPQGTELKKQLLKREGVEF